MNAEKEVIGEVPGNVLGMASDLFHKLQHGKIRPIELELFLKRKNPFSLETVIIDWQRFYRDFFEIKTDFSQVKIPETQPDFDRLIVVAKGFTPNQVFEVCQKNFSCGRYTKDLDKTTKGCNDREPREHYAIWARDRQEADGELKSLSADTLKEKNIKGITLLERLIFELKFWDETGKHLDEKNITLCPASRDSDGFVPFAYWLDGKFIVRWSFPQLANPRLRARAVVSF